MKRPPRMKNDPHVFFQLTSQTILILAITVTIVSIITTIIVWITKFNISENIIPIAVISIPIIISGVAIFLAVKEKSQKSKSTRLARVSKPLSRSIFLVSTQSFPVTIGVILGIFLALIFPVIFHAVHGPPPDTVVTNLMNQEVLAAETHDVGPLPLIYAYNAVVVDAGCQSPSPAAIWSGLPQITDRYSHLPQFLSLAHVNVHITWIPDDSSATRATATADTNGIALINGSKLSLRGHEQWTFAMIDGQWRITLYTYNLC